ncbi:MAG TPA: hypothetical protein VKA84_04240, partial [Gemmatimonadaceae bacterium]|nr:hypothetical protein [Gemmatimonadaceae bacterium]
MNVYVYPTDWSWYGFLSTQPQLDEVNFWRPGGKQAFTRLTAGDLLLFRLRSPASAIAGGGFFVHFSFAPLIKAWEAFGVKNGTPDYESFLRLIASYKELGEHPERAADSTIGCVILAAPFFLPRAQWHPVPGDYPINNPQGHRYDAA